MTSANDFEPPPPASWRREQLGRLRGLKILVVGDAVLDHYELPGAVPGARPGAVRGKIPVGGTRLFAGGAAVICRHLSALGAMPQLVSRGGMDALGAKLNRLLGGDTAPPAHWITHPTFNTPVKTRRAVVTPGGLQIQRCGSAVAPPPPDAAQVDALSRAILSFGPSVDAAIFADFGFGTVTTGLLDRVVPSLNAAGVMLVGDVSGEQPTLAHMRGFHLLAPTETELRALAPQAAAASALPTLAQTWLDKAQAMHLVVTRGSAGVAAFAASNLNGSPLHLPSWATAVVDEVGAGDALLAVMTAACCRGLALRESLMLGNLAAAVAVGTLGNPPLSPRALVHLPTTGDPQPGDRRRIIIAA